MPWPIFDHLWRHESYQPPLLSDRISDLISFRETSKREKLVYLLMGTGFLGFGRNLGKILPASLPELPIQLRDLRSNQKSLKTNFYFL